MSDVGCYVYTRDQRGFPYVAGGTPAWTQFAARPPYTPDPGVSWQNATSSMALDPSDAQTIYVVWQRTTMLTISHDAGATWSAVRDLPGAGLIRDIASKGGGHLWVMDQIAGIRYSANDGVTWSTIVPVTDPNVRRGGMALTNTKIWYALATDATTATDRTWTVWQANLDGSGSVAVGSYFFPGFLDVPGWLFVRPLSDTLAIVTASRQSSEGPPLLGYLSVGSTLANRVPSLFDPWEAMPLSASLWVAVGTPFSSVEPYPSNQDMLIYRTTDAGLTWSLIVRIPYHQGMAWYGTSDEGRRFLDAASSASTVYALGGADEVTQQMIWVSADLGVRWSSVVNTAEPFIDGQWTILGNVGVIAGPAGPTMTAIPSRLATIIG